MQSCEQLLILFYIKWRTFIVLRYIESIRKIRLEQKKKKVRTGTPCIYRGKRGEIKIQYRNSLERVDSRAKFMGLINVIVRVNLIIIKMSRGSAGKAMKNIIFFLYIVCPPRAWYNVTL